MIQVKYPKIECPEYENNYFAVFNSDIREIQTIWDEYRTNNAVLQQFPSSLRDIILSNYEQLVDIYNKYNNIRNQNQLSDGINEEIKERIFNYDKWGNSIAEYFMDSKNGFHLNSYKYVMC